MRTLERVTILLFVVMLLVFAGVKAYSFIRIDRTAPVFHCDSAELEVSMSADETALLAGLTATDDRDGDLTDQIMIKGITQLITDNTAKISYIVFDSANNMASYTRVLRYTDYEKPHFSLSAPLVFPLGSSIILTERLGASDLREGDLTGNICIVSQNVTKNIEGIYSVTVQVTNSLGDTETLALPLVICKEASYGQMITLSDYLIYVEQGTELHPEDYLLAAANRFGQPMSTEVVEIGGSVDTSRAGVGSFVYSYAGYSVYLTVVVK